MAQDVGGAIKGPNRFDTFWGSGADATRIAGGMAANECAYPCSPRALPPVRPLSPEEAALWARVPRPFGRSRATQQARKKSKQHPLLHREGYRIQIGAISNASADPRPGTDARRKLGQRLSSGIVRA